MHGINIVALFSLLPFVAQCLTCSSGSFGSGQYYQSLMGVYYLHGGLFSGCNGQASAIRIKIMRNLLVNSQDRVCFTVRLFQYASGSGGSTLYRSPENLALIGQCINSGNLTDGSSHSFVELPVSWPVSSNDVLGVVTTSGQTAIVQFIGAQSSYVANQAEVNQQNMELFTLGSFTSMNQIALEVDITSGGTLSPSPNPSSNSSPNPSSNSSPNPSSDLPPNPSSDPLPNPSSDPSPNPSSDLPPNPSSDPLPNPSSNPSLPGTSQRTMPPVIITSEVYSASASILSSLSTAVDHSASPPQEPIVILVVVIAVPLVALAAVVLLIVFVPLLVWRRRKVKKRYAVRKYTTNQLMNGTPLCIMNPGQTNQCQPYEEQANCITGPTSSPFNALAPTVATNLSAVSNNEGLLYLNNSLHSDSVTLSHGPTPYEDPSNLYAVAEKKSNNYANLLEDNYAAPPRSQKDLYAYLKKKFTRIQKDDVSLGKLLGKGQFGSVFLGEWKQSNDDCLSVAIKCMQSVSSEEDRVKFLQEAVIMQQFKHIYVTHLYGIVYEEGNVKMIMELLPKGDLLKYLKSLKSKITPPQGLQEHFHKYSYQVAAGMNYLSNKGFIHRDLAARNILMADEETCKIGDFGLSRDLDEEEYYKSKGGKIPVAWTALESLLFRRYSSASDVWSYGVMLYEIWSLGEKPYRGLNPHDLVKKLSSGRRLPPPPGCPRAIYQVMMKCWHSKPAERPTFRNIFEHFQEEGFLETMLNDKECGSLGDEILIGEQFHKDLQNLYQI